MELGDYIRVIRERWIVIVACILVVTAIAAAVTFRTPKVYQSEARLFIARVDESSNKQAYEGGLLSIQRMTTYADLASGPEVAQRVADDLGLQTSAEDLTGRITASAIPQSLLLVLTVQDSDARRAQQIAQSAGKQLIALIGDLEAPPGQVDAPVKATVVDAASLPSTPVSPKPARNIALGFVLGLLLGLGVAVMREVLAPSPNSGESDTHVAMGDTP